MSRTRHHGKLRPDKGLNETQRLRWFCWHRHERTDVRRQHQSAYRRRVKNAMDAEAWDDIPRWRPTRGWLTW